MESTMKKVLILLFTGIILSLSGVCQITVKIGSALQQNPGSDVHLPVSVTGLDGSAGGKGVAGIELHITYSSTSLVYDTSLNFSLLTPSSQWFFGGNGTEYSTNWLEPSGNKVNIPDNTELFEIVFHYLGGPTELIFDSARCLLVDSVYNIIPGVHYINGQVTPSQGLVESKWNGTGPWITAANWSNGIPGDSTNAIIESGEVTILSTAICKSLAINPGCTVNISPGFSLTVNQDYSNNGMFNLQSASGGTGSLIVRGSVAGTGVNNFMQFLEFPEGKPHMASSPVMGSAASVFEGNIVEKYIENTASWNSLSSSEILETGVGYRINGSTPATFTFQGAFLTSDVTINNLSYTSSGQEDSRGYNLLGNPYPSAIQWDEGGWQRTNVDYAVYVWSGYKYLTWNGSIGSLTDGVIPAMKGFFIRANAAGALLRIPGNARLHSTLPYTKSMDMMTNVISMRIENITDTAHYDEAFVNILNGSTMSFDNNLDAFKLLGSMEYPQIFTKSTDQKALSINTQPEFLSIPVEVTTGIAGSYKITFGGIESFSQGQPVFFEDKTSGTIINVRNSNQLVFVSSGTNETGRFILHFQEVGIGEHEGTSLRVWNSEGRIHIEPKNGALQIDQLDIFNLMGQNVYSTSKLSLPATIQPNYLSTGLYILKVKSQDEIWVQKLMVK
jgi:hypothetical protein